MPGCRMSDGTLVQAEHYQVLCNTRLGSSSAAALFLSILRALSPGINELGQFGLESRKCRQPITQNHTSFGAQMRIVIAGSNDSRNHFSSLQKLGS